MLLPAPTDRAAGIETDREAKVNRSAPVIISTQFVLEEAPRPRARAWQRRGA